MHWFGAKSDVTVIQSICTNIINDDELDQLFEDIELSEPEFNSNLSCRCRCSLLLGLPQLSLKQEQVWH